MRSSPRKFQNRVNSEIDLTDWYIWNLVDAVVINPAYGDPSDPLTTHMEIYRYEDASSAPDPSDYGQDHLNQDRAVFRY